MSNGVLLVVKHIHQLQTTALNSTFIKWSNKSYLHFIYFYKFIIFLLFFIFFLTTSLSRKEKTSSTCHTRHKLVTPLTNITHYWSKTRTTRQEGVIFLVTERRYHAQVRKRHNFVTPQRLYHAIGQKIRTTSQKAVFILGHGMKKPDIWQRTEKKEKTKTTPQKK